MSFQVSFPFVQTVDKTRFTMIFVKLVERRPDAKSEPDTEPNIKTDHVRFQVTKSRGETS